MLGIKLRKQTCFNEPSYFLWYMTRETASPKYAPNKCTKIVSPASIAYRKLYLNDQLIICVVVHCLSANDIYLSNADKNV